MEEKRYQIFVSSTFSDLREERKLIIEKLLNAKFIPAGMEMFAASNDEQFEYIKKIIDICDYYVLIIAGRYGTINSNTGKSFTEQEYDYAKSKEIPILVFLYDDPFNLPQDKRDDDKRAQFVKFREKASNNKLCKIWNSPTDLISSVIISLHEEVSANPQQGWSRGGFYNNLELLAQINDLRVENNKLKIRLQEYEEEFHYDTNNLIPLNNKYTILGYSTIGDDISWNKYFGMYTWMEMFSLISPYLVYGISYEEFRKTLINVLNQKYKEQIVSIDEDCFQTIKIQFIAWEFIKTDLKKNKSGVEVEFISLTNKGKRHMFDLKTIKK